MKIFLLLLAPLFIFAKVHYAKVEPYDTVILKSAVSGLIVDVDLKSEGTMVSSHMIIHIDDVLDKINLKDTKESTLLLNLMLKINQEIANSLIGTVKRQESYYNRITQLTTASKTQKDNAYSSYISAKTQYLGTKEKIVSLKKQILDMKYKISQLQDTLNKKSIILTNKYLYKLMVKKGDFVAPGSSLAQIQDTTSAKLTLFLEANELENIHEKIIYINNIKTKYKVNKIWKSADEKFISSYRVEIYIDTPKEVFSKLVKVEIK